LGKLYHKKGDSIFKYWELTHGKTILRDLDPRKKVRKTEGDEEEMNGAPFTMNSGR
jgi:hypothetical protein